MVTQIALGSNSRAFHPETFQLKLLRFIATCHMLFSIVQQPEFRDMILYASPSLRGNDSLPKSASIIQLYLLTLFIASRVILISLLSVSNCMVHLSFDLWSSPNHYSVLGLVCHFIDLDFKARTIIIGMKRLYSPHTGANMSGLIIEALKCYKLEYRLGFCVLDNTSDNNTSSRSVQIYLATLDII
jgi:hypothetical protein